jgi:hypothetical protein
MDKESPASSLRHQALKRTAIQIVKKRLAKNTVFSKETRVTKLIITASRDRGGVEREKPSETTLEASLRKK